MKKRIIIVAIALSCLLSNANAISIDNIGGIIDSITGGNLGSIINKVWDKIDKSTGQVASVCYTPDTSGSSGGDICGLVDKLSNIEVNVCSIAPPIPGFKKKDNKLSLSGLRSLCDAQTKDFADIASSSATNVAENLVAETGLNSESTTLPNGMKVKDYLKRWNVNSILKDTAGTNVARTYFMSKDQSSLRLLMDYDKSANNRGGGDISAISVDNIKAPKDLETYRQNRQELAKGMFNNRKEASATAISASASLSIGDKQGQDAQETALKLLNNKREQMKAARANEIGNALTMYANKNNSMAIPTQETVSLLRKDLQLQAISQIRKQQLEEAAIIAKINEEWDKREAIAELMVDKEVIMNEKFDEKSAQEAIDKVISSVGGS